MSMGQADTQSGLSSSRNWKVQILQHSAGRVMSILNLAHSSSECTGAIQRKSHCCVSYYHTTTPRISCLAFYSLRREGGGNHPTIASCDFLVHVGVQVQSCSVCIDVTESHTRYLYYMYMYILHTRGIANPLDHTIIIILIVPTCN